jgi:L-cystine uptake protein TcyP (sodium:dicarboxylate symporter family)
VPSPWRLTYNNAISILWLALLSAITHSSTGGGGGGGCAAFAARAVGWLHGHHA